MQGLPKHAEMEKTAYEPVPMKKIDQFVGINFSAH